MKSKTHVCTATQTVVRKLKVSIYYTDGLHLIHQIIASNYVYSSQYTESVSLVQVQLNYYTIYVSYIVLWLARPTGGKL